LTFGSVLAHPDPNNAIAKITRSLKEEFPSSQNLRFTKRKKCNPYRASYFKFIQSLISYQIITIQQGQDAHFPAFLARHIA
jgi:hypothetical protein